LTTPWFGEQIWLNDTHRCMVVSSRFYREYIKAKLKGAWFMPAHLLPEE
jgi:hypothetical protein